jgi:hypothetical protein
MLSSLRLLGCLHTCAKPARGRIGVALVCGGLLSGCAPVDVRGPGFGDESSAWANQLRPKTTPSPRFGWSTRAREIEGNLGF